MRLTLQFGPVYLQLISAHAPIEDASEEEHMQFWTEFEQAIQDVADTPCSLLAVGIDANARIGLPISPQIGPCLPSRENGNGSRLRIICGQFDLILANMWREAGTTWVDSYVGRHRID